MTRARLEQRILGAGTPTSPGPEVGQEPDPRDKERRGRASSFAASLYRSIAPCPVGRVATAHGNVANALSSPSPTRRSPSSFRPASASRASRGWLAFLPSLARRSLRLPWNWTLFSRGEEAAAPRAAPGLPFACWQLRVERKHSGRCAR